ncbi:MAG: PQQ-binding-like beta-propeller repeat protein [Dehalococcoidia bacterium]|jgi:outer membrane protein assembly factor BamB|nr:PQQ-binding-like beta-propeller repeat protein [Dehalococcoidia bacterium]
MLLLVVGLFYPQMPWVDSNLPAPLSRSAGVQPGSGSWPIAGGDVGGSRVTAAAVALGAETAWARDFTSGIAVPVVASESLLFVALDDGRLLAIAAADGRDVWSRQLPFALRWAAPTIAGDRLYIATRDGHVQALEAATGELIWDTSLGVAYPSVPVVADGVVYTYYGLDRPDRSYRAPLFGLDAEDGSVLWRQDLDTVYPLVTPVVDERYVAVAAADRLRIFDRISGAETYWYPFSVRAMPNSLALADGAIYAMSSRRLVAVDIDTRTPWHYSIRGAWLQIWAWGLAPRPPAPQTLWVTGDVPREAYAPVVLPDQLIVGGLDGDVRAYSRDSGATLWSREVGPLSGQPLQTAGGLLILQDGALVLLDSSDGSELARHEYPAGGVLSAIVTDHGTYVAGAGGALSALR